VWNNTAYGILKVNKPPEFASAGAFASYVSAKSPDAVLVLLSHDHGDHMGDYFEMLKALVDAGLPVKTCGQSDLMRAGLVQKFKDAGLDPAQVVLNAGAGQNFGGEASAGAMKAWLVPAIHSNLLGYPSAGFVIDMGGVRVYASGDTDLYGDMRLIGDRYHPDLALMCSGGGPYTMGPRDAPFAARLLVLVEGWPDSGELAPQALPSPCRLRRTCREGHACDTSRGPHPSLHRQRTACPQESSPTLGG
jgi:L-ascorbate metabolism protein UlaG (beta-lactamase superfamily)